MTRALLISVRFHDGRYHGAGDWPPSPARLFQALVAAAALPGLDTDKRDALRWLEKLSAPTIVAPAARSGQSVNLFVPNNDLDAKGGDIRRIAEIRSATKRIRPRLFDAGVPLLYIWRLDGDASHTNLICDIANGLYQLGRGVDMAWAIGEVLDESEAEKLLSDYPGAIYRPSQSGNGLALDCPDDGSIASLEIRHKSNARRFTHVDGKTQFENAPKPHFRNVHYNSPTMRLLFELRCTTAPGAPFSSWPLKSAAALVRRLRDGACARLQPHFNGSDVVEKVLIGRNATEADKALRMRIIPLPSIGHVHADGGIRRVLVEVPPDCPIRVDDIAWSFAGLEVTSSVLDEETGEILSSPIDLVKADGDSMLSHYCVTEKRAARLWRSVTPLALPEDAKRRRIDPRHRIAQAKPGSERLAEEQRACAAVAQALRHADVRVLAESIRVQREPFSSKGVRAEAFAEGTRFAKERLWHVELRFSAPLEGPLVIGDGRYLGLGVLAPVHEAVGVLAYRIDGGLSDAASAEALAQALRRAMMARVQHRLGEGRPLPPFFTGHAPDGSPLRGGRHRHLAFVADLPRRRLLIIAPHILERRAPRRDERGYLGLLDEAMQDMSALKAGRSGSLELSGLNVDRDEDCLFGRFKRWESVTVYRPTRHARRLSPNDAIAADVLREVERKGLPAPKVDVLDVRAGPRGGLAGRLRLEFPGAEQGPILLGRTLHLGGGLFRGM